MLTNSFNKQTNEIVLNGEQLTVQDVVRAACQNVRVRFGGEVMERAAADREALLRIAGRNTPIYGVTTGVGANRNVVISPEDMAAYQRRILVSHCVGIGPYYPESVVRAILTVRANALAKGGSGVNPEILHMHAAFLNKGIHPLTPSGGSVGAADLGPLAEMGLAFIGEGEVMYKGEIVPAAQALHAAGLDPVVLGPKDGLILCSHNSASLGHAALLLHRCACVLDLVDLSSSLSLEGFGGNVSPLDARIGRFRPHPGQLSCANDIRAYLEGSYLWEGKVQRTVQDPISFRSVTQVHGACRDVYEFALQGMNIELNSLGDNPFVLTDEEEVVSHGNFHIATIAMRFDFLGIQLSSLAGMIQNRLQRLMTSEFSGLPKFLARREGTTNGFSTLQKTYTALAAEIRHFADPGSLDALPVANGVEDHATMAPWVMQKTERILDKLEYMIGIELMAAAQAIDLRGHPRLGRGTEAAYACIRRFIPPLDDDRVLRQDIESARRLAADGTLLEAVMNAIQNKEE
ncbi:HAL/PAL/TAL family ammonia-lyase [Paenibacillus naphthalenovorans]|uniref:HAL/PAL/TAL family ammonia-lyase n=1 Tax=Paenibacillus naphthalenovorans TaxID=162209 RepID=UPI003D29B323